MYKQEDLLQKVEQEIRSIPLQKSPGNLYAALEYFLNMGGKRLRPLLLLMACDLFEGDVEPALSPAVAVELFHNFTLIHDDMMDQSDIRRGKPTVHRQYGQETALLAGDLMLVNAYQYLENVPRDKKEQVLTLFNKTGTKVCEGQQYDLDYESQEEVGIQEYLDMVELKTAALLAGSLAIGAVMGEASSDDIDRIYEFGRQAGIAFQLQDDILDTFGEESKTGKEVGSDILMNKKTYLLLKAFELADQKAEENLRELLFSNQVEPEQKVKQVRTIYRELDVKQEAESLREQYLDSSIGHLEGLSASSERIQPLKEFAQRLAHRDK